MPVYEITAPDGRTLEIEGPKPPSGAELDVIFQQVKAKAPAPAAPAQSMGHTLTDAAIDALPMIGGMAGGIVGGIGGTVGGMGVGGVPGAVGGATLGGAAGESARQLINRMRGHGAPATMTDAATSIAGQGALQGASEVIGAGVAKGASTAAKAVYRGYLKPSLSARLAPKAAEIVNTALDEAIPISRGGVQTANKIIGELRQEVEDILTNAPGTVDLNTIADKVRRFATKRYNRPGVDPADFQAAMAVASKIDGHPSMGVPRGSVPVDLDTANDIKRALDTSVKETGFGVATGAKKTTEKQARYLINQELRQKAAAIAPLNDRETKLIEATKAIARAVEREANNNQIYGVKSMAAGMGGAAGYGLGVDPGTALATALALRVGFHPAVASRAAIVAYRASKELGITAAQASRLAVAAMSQQTEEPSAEQ